MVDWQESIRLQLEARNAQSKSIEDIIIEYTKMQQNTLPFLKKSNLDIKMKMLRNKISKLKNEQAQNISRIHQEKEILVSQKHEIQEENIILKEQLKALKESEMGLLQQIVQLKSESKLLVEELLIEIGRRDASLMEVSEQKNAYEKQVNELTVRNALLKRDVEEQEHINRALNRMFNAPRQDTTRQPRVDTSSGPLWIFEKLSRFSKSPKSSPLYVDDQSTDTGSSTSSVSTPLSDYIQTPTSFTKKSPSKLQSMGTRQSLDETREPELPTIPPLPTIRTPPYRFVENRVSTDSHFMNIIQIIDHDMVIVGGKSPHMSLIHYIELTTFHSEDLIPEQVTKVPNANPDAEIYSIVVHPSKHYAIATGSQGLVQTFDTTDPSNTVQELESWYSVQSTVSGVTFLCNKFATISHDGILKLWDDESKVIVDVLRASSPILSICSTHHSIYIGCLNGALYICDTMQSPLTLRQIMKMEHPIYGLDVDRKSQKLLLTLADHSIALVQANYVEGRVIYFKHDLLYTAPHTKAKFSSCGTFVYIGSKHHILMWDVNQHTDHIMPFSCKNDVICDVTWTPTYLIATTVRGVPYVFK